MIPQDLPRTPGCYIFKDRQGNIIYIGKAKDLRKRASSYFQKKDHDPKTAQLVSKIDSTDFIATDTETEAFLLENNLIKTHQPKYNIDLKDSKRYAYIQITADEFPRILISRRARGNGKFYGPFTSAESRDHIIQIIKKTFRIRTCRRFPKKPCLRHHLMLCDAPCAGKISASAYQKKIDSAKMILKGQTADLIDTLNSDMLDASQKKEYERALEIRDQITAVERLSERQKMERIRKYDEDIINYLISDNRVYLMLFNVHAGTLVNKTEFDFDHIEPFFEDFIVQHYGESMVPKEIILPRQIPLPLAMFLKKRKGSKVIITAPKQGEKKKLLDLVRRNIELSYFGDHEKVEELGKHLKLKELPEVIECFDISHLSGTSTVGSMVQFRNGRPDRTQYRRFRIRTFTGIDDPRAIAEVIRRRYTRLKKEHATFPSLIVVDGGKGQLTAALAELSGIGLKIPVIALAKRLEEIHAPGITIPLRLDQKGKALLFLREIRDEAHRFAIAYNRLLRRKAIRESPDKR